MKQTTCANCKGSGFVFSVLGANRFVCPFCDGTSSVPDWKTDVREAARVLLKKIENTEVITIAGMNIEAGFGLHRGRLTCNDEELLRSLAEFVLRASDPEIRETASTTISKEDK